MLVICGVGSLVIHFIIYVIAGIGTFFFKIVMAAHFVIPNGFVIVVVHDRKIAGVMIL